MENIMFDSTYQNNTVPVATQADWAKLLPSCANPLGLTEEILEKNLLLYPPVEYEGGTFLGRYLIPLSNVRFLEADQPRAKSNDPEHVANLTNVFEVMGFAPDRPPMVGTLQTDSKSLIEGMSGYHRGKSCMIYGQECYIMDIYEFKTPLDRRVARNKTNHGHDTALSQTLSDYVKEIVNAAAAGEIEKNQKAITELAYRIAGGDKTEKQIKNSIIPNAMKAMGGVNPDFRLYSSASASTAGKFTLKHWLYTSNHPVQGIADRTDEDLIEQGYLTYCAAEGNNKSTWQRAITHGQRLGIPVWIFGYSSGRVEDLKAFRNKWMNQFMEAKDIQIDFSKAITQSECPDGIDEDYFWCKVAGFMPQHIKPNRTKGGSPTEIGLVDCEGNSIKFDPDAKCLSTK